MRKLIYTLLSFVVVAGCAVLRDETSSSAMPPPGSLLILKQELTVPPGKAGVILQYGAVVSEHKRNLYVPNCRLEVNDVLETPQIVKPDQFRVRRSSRSTYVSVAPINARIADGNDGGPTFSVYRTRLDLESANQPQVRWLVCEQWDHPALGDHVSIAGIRAALGSIMELHLPETGGAH